MPRIIPMEELQSLSAEELSQRGYTAEDAVATKAHYSKPAAPLLPKDPAGNFNQDTFFKGERLAEGADLGTVLMTAGKNIPKSAESMVRGTIDLVANAPEIAGAAVDDPGEFFKAVGAGIIDPFTSKEKFKRFVAEDPVGFVSTFTPGLGVVGKGTKFGKALDKLRPSQFIADRVKNIQSAGRGAGSVGMGLLSITTGQDESAIRRSLDSGKDSLRRGVFKLGQESMVGEDTGTIGKFFANNEAARKIFGFEEGDTVSPDAVTQIFIKDLDALHDDHIRALTLAEKTHLPYVSTDKFGDLFNNVNKDLQEHGMSITTKKIGGESANIPSSIIGPDGNPLPGMTLQTKPASIKLSLNTKNAPLGPESPAFGTIDEMIQTVKNRLFYVDDEGALSPRNVSLDVVMNTRKALDEIVGREKHPHASALEASFSNRLNEIIDVTLGPDNPYVQARKFSAESFAKMAMLRKAIGLPNKPPKSNEAREQLGIQAQKALAKAFSTDETRELGWDLMEQMSGKPWQDLLAGMTMKDWVPTGLSGRQKFLAVIPAMLSGAALGAPGLVMTLPMSSPVLVGKTLNAMGVASRPIKAVQETLDLVLKDPVSGPVAKEGIKLGIDIGTVLQRALKEVEEDEENKIRFKPVSGRN